MALGASRTLLALFVTLCTPGCGFSAEKPLRTNSGKQTSVDKGLRPVWEASIHLDGRPVDRFVMSSSRPGRSHRFTKWDKDSRANLFEDVDPEWVNLDGFAVLSAAPVNSAVPVRPPHSPVRNGSSTHRSARVNRTLHPSRQSTSRTSSTKTLRRAPQSSSGPRQPERYAAGTPLLERRRYHHTKPQSDQRKQRQAPKLTSESVHVVSLQAQKEQGQRAANRGAPAKTPIPEPPEYEARDITVRVMSPKSVLISWVDPAVEMGKVEPGTSRSYTVRYREKGESARWEYKDSTQRRMMIEDLSADGMYEFSVRISQGKWSVSVFQRTPESAPSGPPENFEVKPLRGKGTAVIATWDPPEEPNGRIREYILSYAPAMKPFGMKSLTYSGSTSSATVDGLTPGERYIFKIRATNRRGQGPQSKAYSVAMPGSSRTASTPSKNIEVRRTTQAPSEQDTELEESNIETTLAPTITTRTPATTTSTTTTQRPPYKHRRVRPLSQTRSYHSIFSSVRGSVRNGGNRGASKIKEEQTTVPPTVKATTTATTTTTTTTTTTEPPTTTTEMVKPEQDNDVTLFEEEESKPLTTETPSLKIITPSPTKQAPPPPKPPKRRPVKIRVHQKSGSSSKSSSSSKNSPTTTTTATPHIQESAAKRMDYTATAFPKSKNIFDAPVQSKPSTSEDTSLQPEKETGNVGRGTSSRTGGFGGRYGYNRRKPVILFRGNSTRNGYKPALTSAVSSSNANVPSRNQNIQLTPSRHSLASKTDNGGTLNAHNPTRTASASVSNRQETTDGLYFDKSTSTQSKLHGGTTSNGQSTSHSSSEHLTNMKPNENSQSSSDGQRYTKADNTQNSRHASSREEEGSNGKRTANTQAKVEPVSSSKDRIAEGEKASSQSRTHMSSSLLESAKSDNTGNSKQASSQNREGHYDGERDSKKVESSSSSKAQISEGDKIKSQSRTQITSSRSESAKSDSTENSRHTSSQAVEGNNDRESDGRKVESASSSKAEREKAISQSRTRISSSLLEKYPWLATKYPHRFGSAAARTSTSVSTSRPDGRTPVTRTSSSSSSSSSSSPSSSSSIGAGRPILRGTPTRVSGANGAAGVSTIQETSETNEEDKNVSKLDSLKNNIGTEAVKPVVNKEVSDTRQPATSTTSAHSSGPKDRSEMVHRETITDNESHEKEHIDDDDNEKNDQKTPTTEVTSKNTDNESAQMREDATNTRTISSSGGSPTMRRPNIGSNGRGRSPLSANRQFGNRFSVRPAQNSKLDSESSSIAKPVLTSDSGGVGNNGNTVQRTGGLLGGTSQSSTSSSTRDGSRAQGGRSRYPISRGKPVNSGGYKPANGNGKNGRPNLTTAEDKDASSSHESTKSNGQKYITRPDGTKWLVDLERGILMNSEGKILQDSQGRPKRVVLGEDGRTIFDHMGSPLVTQEGVALFGNDRDSSPVINPKDKMLMVGGKPVRGLDLPNRRTTSTTTTTTTTTTATTTTTTTTLAPTTTTTTEAPTTEWTTPAFPTCPPGTYSKTDEFGYPEVDEEGILDCYPIEEESSGMEDLEKDELMPQTTLLPTTTSVPTTEVQPRPSSKGPSSEFDLSGKKRFTAPYVNYIQKDPGAPCSLTEALEYLQVDVLEDLMEKDNMLATQNQPPKHKPHNLTVVAMEGCHSFIILDWARPLKDDMVSGYMVYSASYDDVLNSRWSSKASSGTHLAVENLKPNSRYYFKVQAKNVFGLGPISETLTYVTESDDPLLIERPPGGEPIWIPFKFKYNPAHSTCTGSQFVKRTWYRKFVGVVLCNSLRYKIFMGDELREPFYSIGDTLGQGEDHCQFVDSYRDGRTGPAHLSNTLPSAQGYYRAYRQEPVTFGVIGRRTNHPFVGWYECGVPIPGKW